MTTLLQLIYQCFQIVALSHRQCLTEALWWEGRRPALWLLVGVLFRQLFYNYSTSVFGWIPCHMEQSSSQGSVGWCLDCEGSRASRADHVQDLGSSCYRMPAQGFPQELMETFYFDIVWVWHVLCAFGTRPSWWWTSGHHVAGLQVCKALQGDPPYHRVHFWTNSGWGLNLGEMWNIYAVAVTRRSYSRNKELTQVQNDFQVCQGRVAEHAGNVFTDTRWYIVLHAIVRKLRA